MSPNVVSLPIRPRVSNDHRLNLSPAMAKTMPSPAYIAALLRLARCMSYCELVARTPQLPGCTVIESAALLLRERGARVPRLSTS